MRKFIFTIRPKVKNLKINTNMKFYESQKTNKDNYAQHKLLNNFVYNELYKEKKTFISMYYI